MIGGLQVKESFIDKGSGEEYILVTTAGEKTGLGYKHVVNYSQLSQGASCFAEQGCALHRLKGQFLSHYRLSVLHRTGDFMRKNLQQSRFTIVGLPRAALSADSKPT